MANSNLRTGDTVLVIAGKEKGKTGKIISSDAHKGRVVVENINIVHKHRKPRSQKDQGGIKKSEAPIDVSNVQIICPSCKKATRIGHSFDDKGNKHRVCKKCGAYMDAERKVKTLKTAKVKEKADSKAEVKADSKAVKETKSALPKAAKTDSTKASKAVSKVDGAKTQRKTPQAKSQGK